MNKQELKQLQEDIEQILMELDANLSGRSNMLIKTDLYVLRNLIVRLQEKYDQLL